MNPREIQSISWPCLMIAAPSLKQLITACFHGDVEGIKAAIGAGVNLNEASGVHRALSVAAQQGHLDAVKCLLDHGADLNGTDKDGFQAIHLAASKSRLAVVDFLVSRGVDIHAPLVTGWRVIHVALRDGALDAVKHMIRNLHVDVHEKTKTETKLELVHIAAMYGLVEALHYLIDELHVDMNTKDAHGLLPLHLAAIKGQNKAIDFFYSRTVDLFVPTPINQRIIHLASAERHTTTVIHLIEKYHMDPNDTTADLRPIHLASTNGVFDLVQYLLSCGVDPNTPGIIRRPNKDNTELLVELHYPLHMACSRGHLEIAKLLHEKGADISIASSIAHVQATHHAAQHGRLAVLEFLVSKGADINAKQTNNDSPLISFLRSGRNVNLRASVEFLVGLGADINVVGDMEWTVLHYAAYSGDVELTRWLIEEKKLNPMQREAAFGREPLHLAAASGHVGILSYLRQIGLPMNAFDTKGYRPLHLAAQEGHLECVKFLVASGADPNDCVFQQWTALDAAEDCGHVEIAEFLRPLTQTLHDSGETRNSVF